MSSLDICASIRICKNCSLLSNGPKYFQTPAAVSLPTHRRHQIHLRRPTFALLSVARFSSDAEQDNFSPEGSELYEEQTLSDEEEVEDFDVLELERQARQAVKEYSDSLSLQLKIGSFLQLFKFSWVIVNCYSPSRNFLKHLLFEEF